MDLVFPELMGGPVQGLNDAGVENFQGAIDAYIARECGQNAGDAVRPGVKTVRLEFDRLTVEAGNIPGFAELCRTLVSCLERWGSREKEREFFEAAIGLGKCGEIPVLKISDYGTTGLTGDDTEETGRWFALVKSQGVSNKEDTAGGSFGIGKSSPFAASRFRTVFYGTRTDDGSVALQGISRLVTHKDSDGRLTQGVGFIGDRGHVESEPVFRAVRDPDRMPAPFRRTETGTDIWVIGYRSGAEWSDDLVRSILTNFWPAIHRGSIEFRVGSESITRGNVGELIDRFAGNDDFQADKFYRAIMNAPVRKTLKAVGQCELYLNSSTPDLPNRICMARNSGMRIYDYWPKACRVPFSGLFICNDDQGNKLLRKLEPPKHDTWDPKRVEDGSGKRALDEIKLWIREEVKKLNPLFGGKSFNETELAKYLPDTPADDANQPLGDQAGTVDEESLEPRSDSRELQATPVKARPTASAPSGANEGGIGRDGDAGRSGHGNGHRGVRTHPGGGSAVDDLLPRLGVRSFASGHGVYKLILRSPVPFKGALQIAAVGEDGSTERVRLMRAVNSGEPGKTLSVRGDIIGGIEIDPGVPFRLSIELDALGRRSLRAVAVP